MKRIDLSIWKMGSRAPKNIRYQVEEFIIKQITNSDVYWLPSQRTFATINNLEPSLVKRAYSNLVSLGWLSTRNRSGTTVANCLPNRTMDYQQTPFKEQLPIALVSADLEVPALPAPAHNFRSIGLDRLSEYYYPKSLYKYLKFHRNRYKDITQEEQVMAYLSPRYKNTVRKYMNTYEGFRLNAGCMAIAMGRKESLSRIFSLLLKPGSCMANTAGMDLLLRDVLHSCKARSFEMNAGDSGFLTSLEACLVKTPVKVIYVNTQCVYPESNPLNEETWGKLKKTTGMNCIGSWITILVNT